MADIDVELHGEIDKKNDHPMIVKKILYLGTRNANFTNGCRVYFHFQTRICNKNKTIIDDSRKMGSGTPMELVLGKKFKLEIWETIIQKMAIKEVAQFTVDKSLVMQYPFISKTLRDSEKPEAERSRHCCGATLQAEGMGYKDLNMLLKYPQDLEFTIELIEVLQPDEYNQESWQLTEAEKLSRVPILKERGNNAYADKEYGRAVQYYFEAISYLEQLMLKEKPHDEEWLALQKQKVPLLLNYSQCKLYEKDYYSVIEHCSTVLKIEPDNVKALYRRAQAHVGAWNPDQARKDFNRVMELDKTLVNSCKDKLKELNEMIKLRKNEEKTSMKKLF